MIKIGTALFEAAEQSGKKVMIFLGTRLTSDSESSENFRALSAFTEQYYGDDYVYYYKGHPATPTGANPERLALLDELGITDIESSIAAELIFFFYPEANLSGYSSTRRSTFRSRCSICCRCRRWTVRAFLPSCCRTKRITKSRSMSAILCSACLPFCCSACWIPRFLR